MRCVSRGMDLAVGGEALAASGHEAREECRKQPVAPYKCGYRQFSEKSETHLKHAVAGFHTGETLMPRG